ncbi:MAG: insulinase family protein [Methanobacteriota archaeon]|nr:MAG: insulinase family protein [Euryarchaeota archaeon]
MCEGRAPRPRRARDRSRGRQVASHPAESDGSRAGEATGPLLGPVRTGWRHVPRDAAQRRRRTLVLGLRRSPARKGREGPRAAHPRGRSDVSRGRASVRRPIPCPGGNRLNLPDRTALGNGAVLISHALPSNPFVAFRGSIPAGVASEGDAHGVAEFASRLLLSGTRHRGAAKLADRLEGIGATLEFHNGEELLGFNGRCTRDSLRETIRILVECLSEPTFPQREIDRVRGELLNDLRIEADDTHSRAARELARFVFPNDHPYGRDPKGGTERVRRIRRRDLVEFHESHVGSDGLILAVTGEIDRELVEEAIAAPLSRLDADQEGIPAIPPPPPHKPRRATIPMPHKTQADIAIGGPAVPRRHADYYALNLANLLFGRIGLYGRLGRNLRDEQGLAYYAFTGLDARTAGGMWSLSAGVNPANLEKAVQSIRAELDRLQTDPFHADEIQDGRDNQIGSLIVSLERNAEVASELHRMEYYGLGMNFLERFPEIVRDLEEDRIRAVAVKYFTANGSSMVVAGPVGRARLSL